MGRWDAPFLIWKEYSELHGLTEASGARGRFLYMRQPTVIVLHDAAGEDVAGVSKRAPDKDGTLAERLSGGEAQGLGDEYLHNERGGRGRTCAGGTALFSRDCGPVRGRATQALSRDGSHQSTHEILGRHSRGRSADRGHSPSYPACSCRLHARRNCDTGVSRPGCRIVGSRSGSAQTPRLIARGERMLISPVTRQ